jgi:hypothetical protein
MDGRLLTHTRWPELTLGGLIVLLIVVIVPL